MIEISVSGIKKSFEIGNNILDGITFQVETGERVGLLGRNGAGKSTLFKILTGELEADEGSAVIAKNSRIGLISQIPVYPEGYTVDDVLQTAFSRHQKLAEEMERLTAAMAAGDAGEQTLRRYGELSAKFEGIGGYDTGTAVSKVANGLSISLEMRAQLFASLSGGEKTRVNLGRLILEDTDILLLDEPTNHLDLHAVEWLEDYVRHFKGTVVAISHDRYFLDRTITRVIEILDGKAEFYPGNYTFYAIEKERRYQEKLKQYEKEQAKIKQLQEAADKLHLWAFMGNDKLHKRAFSMERRIERIRQTEKPTKAKAMTQRFGEKEFSGDEVLHIKDLEKSFESRRLFRDINLLVEGGERIALIGDNGTGKSTLLKILMGEEQPDSGRIRFGPAVRTAYLPQIIRFDNPNRSLVDTMLYAKHGMTTQTARDRLGAFNFRGEDVFKTVSVLSGGEQSRLRLCMLMDEEINLLILDEPTNHLDIAIEPAGNGSKKRWRPMKAHCCSSAMTATSSTVLPPGSGNWKMEPSPTIRYLLSATGRSRSGKNPLPKPRLSTRRKKISPSPRPRAAAPSRTPASSLPSVSGRWRSWRMKSRPPKRKWKPMPATMKSTARPMPGRNPLTKSCWR